MKKLFLFLFASLLSVSIFAEDPEQPTGKTKSQAIPYNWNTGIVVTSEPNVGKWYVVNLDMSHGGIFYDKEYIQAWNDTCAVENRIDIKKVGKTVQGNTEANITVVNPLNEKIEVDITAYIAANEYSHHYALQAKEAKALNVGAGMLVKMGNYKVYLYLVMDVEITQEQAEEMPQVKVNIDEAPANSIAFVPDTFNWTGFGPTTSSEGNIIPANKEVWLYVDWNTNLDDGYTLKLHAQTTNGAATTVYGGLAMDCPATSIQEQSTELSLNEIAHKTLDPAMLDMVPGAVYVRLQADQPLHVWATEVTEASVLPSEPIFNTAGSVEIEKNHLYPLSGSDKYYVTYETLTDVPEYYYMQVELTNNSGAEVTLNGKAAKNANGNVYSVMSHDVTIGAHQTLRKEIDNSILSNLATNDKVYALVTGGNENISFKLVQVCTEKDPCDPANVIPVVIQASPDAQAIQAANTTEWYKVDITEALKEAVKGDIELTLEANGEVSVNVDIATDCALGEPTQSYSATAESSSYTLNYSLIKDVEKASDDHYYLYVRVNCDKQITVTGKLLTAIVYNNGWVGGNEPTLAKSARIETDLTIADDETVKALGVTLAGGKITIENGGKLIVGSEGIKGSETIDQITIEDGGKLFIDPAAETNNKPFITAKKNIFLGKADDNADLDDYHAFIALPIENREAGLGAAMRYSHWDYTAGWISSDKFRKAFVGYNVFTNEHDASYTTTPANLEVAFKGQLAPNKNQTLVMPGRGWHAFGNSWFDAIDVANIYNQLGGATDDEVAVHLYVNEPKSINGAWFQDNFYVPVTSANYTYVGAEYQKVAAMQGFFLYTESGKSITLNYNSIYDANKNAAPAAKRATNNITSNVAVVLRGGNRGDNVFLVEGEGSNVHKMISDKLAIYAEDGLAQVANSNLIGTMLTIKTNEATEYTLSFAWLNGETLYLKDLVNGNIIAMTAENTYTFTAEPNTTAERFQVVGRNDAPTAIENSEFIEGANKFIENGKIVIIKNGVKYNVLGAQL